MDLQSFKSNFSLKDKIRRQLWDICWMVLFRPSPRLLHGWRRLLLRLFGANIGVGVRIDNRAKVFYPPNLTLCDYVVIGFDVDIYCVAPIQIGKNSMVSQYSYLCAASHDYTKSNLPLIAKQITIGESTWICARAFIGPGVTIGQNSLVAACSVVIKDVDDNTIAGGNPAKFIKTKPESVQT